MLPCVAARRGSSRVHTSSAAGGCSSPLPPRHSPSWRRRARSRRADPSAGCSWGCFNPPRSRPSGLLDAPACPLPGIVFPRPTSGAAPHRTNRPSPNSVRRRAGSAGPPPPGALLAHSSAFRSPSAAGLLLPGPLAPCLRPVPPAEGCPSPSARGSLTQARLPAYLPLSKFRLAGLKGNTDGPRAETVAAPATVRGERRRTEPLGPQPREGRRPP